MILDTQEIQDVEKKLEERWRDDLKHHTHSVMIDDHITDVRVDPMTNEVGLERHTSSWENGQKLVARNLRSITLD